MIYRQSADIPHPDLYIGSCCSKFDARVPNELTAVDSPAFHMPAFRQSNPLGILHGFPTYAERPRDRSVSPRTQSSSDQGNKANTTPPSMDPVRPPGPRPSRHISVQSRSDTSSQRYSIPPGASSTSSNQPLTHNRRRLTVLHPPFEMKCCCALRSRETHIFNALIASSSINPPVPTTIETNSRCEYGENRVQIYETLPNDPSILTEQGPLIWWVTRRLVISYLSGTPEMRLCSSFCKYLLHNKNAFYFLMRLKGFL